MPAKRRLSNDDLRNPSSNRRPRPADAPELPTPAACIPFLRGPCALQGRVYAHLAAYNLANKRPRNLLPDSDAHYQAWLTKHPQGEWADKIRATMKETLARMEQALKRREDLCEQRENLAEEVGGSDTGEADWAEEEAECKKAVAEATEALDAMDVAIAGIMRKWDVLPDWVKDEVEPL